MPRFNVYGRVTGSKFIGQYEAKSMGLAIEQAEQDAAVNLCHHCDNECEDPQVTDLEAEEVAVN